MKAKDSNSSGVKGGPDNADDDGGSRIRARLHVNRHGALDQDHKSAVALLAAGLMWTLYSFASPIGVEGVVHQLTEKLAETAAIVFFLISAMTIVEVVDGHGGFEVITNRI